MPQAMQERSEAVFEAVFILAIECEDEYTHLSACRCLAAMLNKAPLGNVLGQPVFTSFIGIGFESSLYSRRVHKCSSHLNLSFSFQHLITPAYHVQVYPDLAG